VKSRKERDDSKISQRLEPDFPNFSYPIFKDAQCSSRILTNRRSCFRRTLETFGKDASVASLLNFVCEHLAEPLSVPALHLLPSLKCYATSSSRDHTSTSLFLHLKFASFNILKQQSQYQPHHSTLAYRYMEKLRRTNRVQDQRSQEAGVGNLRGRSFFK